MTLHRVRILSPNYSSRGGAGVRLIVLHTAEGALTYQSLGSFFQNPASGVSSHVGIDDTPNTVGEYVDRNMKAWTAANANPVAVQAELCAFASWNLATWNSHQEMLNNTARWIAEEAATFSIPIVRLSAQQAQSNGRGICQHSDLGSWGGNHSDCGPAFPIDSVIAMASGGISTPQQEADDNMVLFDPVTGGYWIAFRDGAVHTDRGAPYLGGTNNPKTNAGGFPCIGIAAKPNNDGYVLVLDYGNNPPQRARIYDFPRDGSGIVH